MITIKAKDIQRSTYESKLIIPCTVKQLDEAMQLAAKSSKGLEVKIKPYREGRSKTANDYMWVLCTKLSKKLSKEYPITKEEIYQRQVSAGNSYYIFPIANEKIDDFKKKWSSKGIGWFAEIRTPCKKAGYTNVFAYYGSSQYDTKEMSDLINRMVEEAKQQGIETLAPHELEVLKSEWR